MLSIFFIENVLSLFNDNEIPHNLIVHIFKLKAITILAKDKRKIPKLECLCMWNVPCLSWILFESTHLNIKTNYDCRTCYIAIHHCKFIILNINGE